MNKMMKFRVFNCNTNSYRYSDEFNFISGFWTYIEAQESQGVRFTPVEQCLGIKDKNGKLIYAGDKLRKIKRDFVDITENEYNDIESLPKEIQTEYIKHLVEDKRQDVKKIISASVFDCKISTDYYLECVYESTIEDISTTDRFPLFWLKGEGFGYEGEDLQSSDEWIIIGNVNEG